MVTNNLLKLFIPVWMLYSIVYISLKFFKLTTLAGYQILFGQVGLDVFLCTIAFLFYRKAIECKSKLIFLLYFLSFVSAAVADGVYHLGMNILNIQYFYKINSLFEIPFIGFLLFQLLAWGVLFFKQDEYLKPHKKNIYIPYILVSIIIFTAFTFGITWKIDHLSLIGIYQLIDTILEIFGFVIVTICLTRANSSILKLASIGYLIIISSDLLIRNQVISGFIPFLSIFEVFWVLGLLLMSIGFFLRKTTHFHCYL